MSLLAFLVFSDSLHLLASIRFGFSFSKVDFHAHPSAPTSTCPQFLSHVAFGIVLAQSTTAFCLHAMSLDGSRRLEESISSDQSSNSVRDPHQNQKTSLITLNDGREESSSRAEPSCFPGNALTDGCGITEELKLKIS